MAQAENKQRFEGIPQVIQMRAQYILSHCLLPAQIGHTPTIIDSGCDNGMMTYVMACYAPHMRFIGVDRNPQAIERAVKKYGDLPNLYFITADVTEMPFATHSADALISSQMLGPLYTRHEHAENSIPRILNKQMDCVKEGGSFVLFDTMAMADHDYVLMEFPTTQKMRQEGELPEKIKETDRAISNLIWFHDNARPKQADGCQGFFLDEMPQKLPFTRLFRLPAKWAYEFIIRHESYGKTFRKNIALELTCLNEYDVCNILPQMGCRVDYTAPWTNPYVVKNFYKSVFRLYHCDYTPRPYPHTGHIFVARKYNDNRAIKLLERKQAKSMPKSLEIQSTQDMDSGEIHDLISIQDSDMHIIPYQLLMNEQDEVERVHVYLNASCAKAIANAIPRSGNNLDGREWSGYIPSALKVSKTAFTNAEDAGDKGRFTMMKREFGLRPDLHAAYEEGPKGYPAPDLLELLIETRFVPIHDREQTPKAHVQAFDLDDVLRAITAGLIPDAWLEVQLTQLKINLQGKRHSWMSAELPIGNEAPPQDRILRVADILNQVEEREDAPPNPSQNNDQRYRDSRGGAGQLKAVRSVFVEEGLRETNMRGLTSREVDFAVPTASGVNKAAILSLTRDLDGNAMAGFDHDQMPVPYRMGQQEKMMNMPTVTLPDTVTDIDSAKAYLAEKFDTDIEKVVQMGPSFFSAIDYTPERIYPFAIARQGGWGKLWDKFYAPIQDLWIFDETDYKWSFLYSWGFAVLGMAHTGGVGSSTQPRIDEQNRRFAITAPRKDNAHTTSAQWTSTKNRNDNKKTPQPRKHALK